MEEECKESVHSMEDEQNEPEIIEVMDKEDNIVDEGANESEESILKLKKEIERIQKEQEETQEKFLRVQAEFDNFKRRTQKERTAERKYKSQDLVNELLPALDNFERALEVSVTDETKGVIDGITMVYNQLKDALKTEGVDVIETVGKEFDPNLHHAVMQVEEEEEASNIVLEELQKGYILNDRVVRPAMVKVNK